MWGLFNPDRKEWLIGPRGKKWEGTRVEAHKYVADISYRIGFPEWEAKRLPQPHVLGPKGALTRAFANVGKAVEWWFEGPGMFIHGLTGPDEYTDAKPFCHVGPACVRCQRAVLARAVVVSLKVNPTPSFSYRDTPSSVIPRRQYKYHA